jgi:ornithine cyclodeaminase
MSPAPILYLDSEQVFRLSGELDPVQTVKEALIEHAMQRTILPAEAYLSWSSERGPGRSLAMPGVVFGYPGLKVINANATNRLHGIPRATGLTMLFDPESGKPLCIMQGARLSALRTASVTILAAQLLQPSGSKRVAVLGAGVQAAVHIEMICSKLCRIQQIVIYDLEPARAVKLRDLARCQAEAVGIELVTAPTAEAAIRGSEIIVTVTTSNAPYIPIDWLDAGVLVVHVSLDDLLPEVLLNAEKLFVDDWHLVAADERRILGKLIHSGLVASPSQIVPKGFCGRRVMEFGSVLIGAHSGRGHDKERIIVNPFGLAIEDLAIALKVYHLAQRAQVGHLLAD